MAISCGRIRRTATVLAVIGLTAAGCASLAIHSYADRSFAAQRYRTFDWGPPDAFSTGDPRLDHNRFFDERVRLQVEQELARGGFEKTTSPTPDLLVHYHASVTQEIEVRHIDRGYGDCEDTDCSPQVYEAGTLVIDLVDPRTSRLVWRGWAEGSIDGLIDNQEWMEKRIDETVSRILSRLSRRL
jgi:hypothetical protein